MMLTTMPRLRLLPMLAVIAMPVAVASQDLRGASQDLRGASQDPTPVGKVAPNPYRFKRFEPSFPVKLEYPPMLGLEYSRTRRQVLRQLASNLQGNVRRDAWHLATEFYWRAPEDAAEPLIEAMDRAMGNPAFADVVRNCVEAMGKMAIPEFDAALRRALQHKSDAVRQSAYSALAVAGTEDSLRQMVADFVHMNGRARQAWLGAVRKRLPKERVAILRAVMMANYPAVVRDQVIKEAVQLPAAEAAAVMRGRWSEAADEFKAIIAGALHASGDGAGTAWLRDAIRGEEMVPMRYALMHCVFGDDADQAVGVLREDLLRATTHLRPEVRLEAAKVLSRLSGDDIVDVFEVLASPDEVWEIRGLAVRQLTRRGSNTVVSVLLEELPTATGTRLRGIINQLSASGDVRAVPVLRRRFEKAPEGDGRPFLQAIAQSGSSQAAEALCQLFAGPNRLVDRSAKNPLTTRRYLPLLLLNLRGGEHTVLEFFQALPKEKWELRSLLMPTIVGYAVDRRDQETLRDACLSPIRAILFDRSELPQLRVQALNLLARNWLTIDDVMRLKKLLRKEDASMRGLLANFLNDAF